MTTPHAMKAATEAYYGNKGVEVEYDGNPGKVKIVLLPAQHGNPTVHLH